MQKMKLSDKAIAGLPFAPKGSRYEVADLVDDHLRLRVGPRSKTMVYVRRFGEADDPTRRKIGKFPHMTIAEARAVATSWGELAEKRIDPREEDERRREERTLRRRHTCRSVLEDYIVAMPNRDFNRSVPEQIELIRRLLLKPGQNACWLDKPISEVTGEEIAGAVEAVRLKPAPAAAYNLFSILRTFFNWASSPARKSRFGLADNPIRGLTHKDLSLRINAGTRVLTALEARACLAAAAATPYPYGPFATAVLTTGQRLREVAGMRWSELRLAEKLWVIPEERFKTGTTQRVPLSDAMIVLLEDIQRLLPAEHGDCVFSTTNGRIPINGFSKAKEALDRKMLEILRENDPLATLPNWTWHDARRTLRTQIEAFASRPEIGEVAIGHVKKGLQKVYNHYTFRRELRAAFNGYAALLEKAKSGSLDIDEWCSDDE
ncbi:tyrosine-type recombinase/integrase [Rhizobium leguminosarum bv. viciae]|uniref:Tyrosine-type recombinase/integrase n=1 Tax=Rhizobium leguminosarum bv. viciae TaxID=387 RepID=A0A8I2GKH4_RHILV|nr:tyrosine-type recombinase/integrase [Rhizobium leguminosarum]NKM44315.1 tyrosine-type recombinase/integrase [Rhizobium leguminosarum bv. viciae]